MPALYGRALPWLRTSAPADDSGWRPRLIVVELGTNDFSAPLQAGERWSDLTALRRDFRAGFLAFARTLIARQPQARLMLVAPDTLSGEMRTIAGQLGRAGGMPVRTMAFGAIEWGACRGHPTLADHRLISTRLLAAIERAR